MPRDVVAIHVNVFSRRISSSKTRRTAVRLLVEEKVDTAPLPIFSSNDLSTISKFYHFVFFPFLFLFFFSFFSSFESESLFFSFVRLKIFHARCTFRKFRSVQTDNVLLTWQINYTLQIERRQRRDSDKVLEHLCELEQA